MYFVFCLVLWSVCFVYRTVLFTFLGFRLGGVFEGLYKKHFVCARQAKGDGQASGLLLRYIVRVVCGARGPDSRSLFSLSQLDQTNVSLLSTNLEEFFCFLFGFCSVKQSIEKFALFTHIIAFLHDSTQFTHRSTTRLDSLTDQFFFYTFRHDFFTRIEAANHIAYSIRFGPAQASWL